ncbi:pseudouridine synthase [Pavlovales sp. CCMP2436]|nr:pseudouridine synthase [Pavlovales sp. CCMP2436]|mmetsp:Transcript_2389/g.5845  ORF Transcript_2389/g.5845 Transcript_2389/m.5845 type:complete len:368 (+) Transcript_2389:99-1202(+)
MMMLAAIAAGAVQRAARPGFVERSSFVVQPAQSLSLADALRFALPDEFQSLSAARRAIRKGVVHVDDCGSDCAVRLSGGERVSVLQRSGALSDARPARGGERLSTGGGDRLEVLYEDDEIAVVIKPQGIPTQGSSSNGSEGRLCAHSLLPHSLEPSAAEGCLRRPQHVHRLDAGTGGVLVVAKTHRALVALSSDFAERRVDKTYRAILGRDRFAVQGELSAAGAAGGLLLPPTDGSGRCDDPIGGKAAHTEYTVLRRLVGSAAGSAAGSASGFDEVASVELRPKSGRTHQLRRHMAALGWPIVCDPDKHYSSSLFRAASPSDMPLFLWASAIRFTHPASGKVLSFEKAPPPHFESWPASQSLLQGAE